MFLLILKPISGYKMVDFIVGFCVLLSFCGLISEYSSENYELQIAELTMVLIWLASDWNVILNLLKKDEKMKVLNKIIRTPYIDNYNKTYAYEF